MVEMRSPSIAILLLPVIACAQGKIAMPEKLWKALDVGTTRQSLSLLKGNPKLANCVWRESKMTALHFASARGKTEVVHWLVRHKADVNARCGNEFSALHLAANGKIAGILLRAGAKTKIYGAGMTPLQYAAYETYFGIGGKREVAEAILKSGEVLDLATALCLDKREQARRMIRADPARAKSLRFQGHTNLHLAARNGDIDTARLLLDLGMDVNVEPTRGPMGLSDGPYTALSVAAAKGRVDMMKFLCERGADPDKVSGGFKEPPAWGVSDEVMKVLRHYRALRKK